MRFLLDENISGHTEACLISLGHEVIRPISGSKDKDILVLSKARQAVLITRDRDFLNFLPSPLSGIIYVRIHPSIAERITKAIRNLLDSAAGLKLRGKVIILREGGCEIFR